MAKTPLEPLEFLRNRKPLSETELEYMRVIWNHPEGISSEEIYSMFPNALGTKSTILFRISEKGYVNVERDGVHYVYTPQVTERQYNQAIMQKKMKKTFGITKLPDFIAAFCGRKELTEEEAKKMEEMIRELEDD